MKRKLGIGLALAGLLAILPAGAQQPKFEIADVHVSTTAHGLVQNFVLSVGKGGSKLKPASGLVV